MLQMCVISIGRLEWSHQGSCCDLAKAVMAEGGAADVVDHPTPPYSRDTDDTLGEGLKCYYGGCSFSTKSYGSMMTHVRNRHKQKMSALNGTHFHTMALKDLMSAQSKYREQKKKDPTQKQIANQNKSAKSKPIEATPQQFKWLIKPCFVKCSMEGVPLEPIQTCGLAIPGMVPPPPGCEGNLTGQMASSSGSASSVPKIESPASSSTTQQIASPADMLTSIFAYIEDKKDTGKWLNQLPSVSIKAQYLNLEPPLAKGEGVCRAVWPKSLERDFVELPEYKVYLEEIKNKKESNADKPITGAGRAIGFLDITPHPSMPEVKASSVEVLVALYTSSNHRNLLKSPLLNSKYHWSQNILTGLALYCQFHIRELNQKLVTNATQDYEKYKAVLMALEDDLTSGSLKRCAEHKAESQRLKQQTDLILIKQISIPMLQAAVLRGYKTLATIEATYKDAPLPKNVRGLANAILAGGIAFDTFSGRKKEWEIMSSTYVHGVLDKNGECLVCSDHKTARTYGSIAKLLTPGLLGAFSCYAQLHKPEKCNTFLVPAVDSTAIVSLPGALKQFCSYFLGADCPVWPTYNLMRKLFHSELMRVTADKDKLKLLMIALDAHSKKVQDQFYILRDPEDDIVLAKALVKAVLGKTVVWPDGPGNMDDPIRFATGLDMDEDGDGTEEVDDETLEYFEGSEMFGVVNGNADATHEATTNTRKRRKIGKDLEAFAINMNLATEGGEEKALSKGFFTKLLDQAIAEELLSEAEAPSAEGLRQVVRDYFKDAACKH